ncbi:MAG TPA: MaoC/PaaZ C-terminal domain-containing protein [Kofleriaceae bacterium]|nr:MaoC/PaaZ C-terminal domain-containing protein [Kofleriaceae bacterium]
MLPARHILRQGPVVRSLGGTAMTALLQRVRRLPPRPAALPAPAIDTVVPPPSAELVRDYLRNVGGDPAAYRGVLPPHLFPHWGFPLAARTLRDLPYPLLRVLNGGCRLEVRAPLPAGEPLHVSARLESIDDDGRRVVLCQRVTTGPASDPESLIAHLYAIVPLEKKSGATRAPARVPPTARELAYWTLPADAGLAFAMLTGDFNPVHWIHRYARASGFRGVILHGFATMARAIEGLHRARAAAPGQLRTFDCRFTRPLILPARVGLYTAAPDRVWVGDAPGGPAYLTGTFAYQGDPS